MSKSFFILLLFSFDSYASVEFELISRMSKDVTHKELLENYSLCSEYNSLYLKLSKSEQNLFVKLNCKAIPLKDAESISKKYLAEIEKKVTVIPDIQKAIDDNESNIVLKHYIP